MFTVNEVSKIAGISIRTLQYYDKIGLLRPSDFTSAGYRLYDESSLELLQTILFFRELEFPLKEIKSIISDPDFDRRRALEHQIELLKLRREQIEKVISLAEDLKNREEKNLDFSAFDKTKIMEYEKEAKEKWGGSAAFDEYEAKAEGRSESQNSVIASEMMEIFAEFGKISASSPESSEAQELVKKLQNFITENYYTCTDKILRGLGQMYVSDERFMENIDKAGGKGTADFVSKAISAHCANKD
ncbi:MAG: MerR family transcriptional regulator [Oscillospiraceae bacterium]|nr:MerR family transcriptional regulator [Oscillospiraceae bacterium]